MFLKKLRGAEPTACTALSQLPKACQNRVAPPLSHRHINELSASELDKPWHHKATQPSQPQVVLQDSGVCREGFVCFLVTTLGKLIQDKSVYFVKLFGFLSLWRGGPTGPKRLTHARTRFSAHPRGTHITRPKGHSRPAPCSVACPGPGRCNAAA